MPARLLRAALLGASSILLTGAALAADAPATATPIQHLVVIFQENVSFDHYFATYPNATNPAGEPSFTALPNTPGLKGNDWVNTLAAAGLLTGNGNATNTRNGADAAEPFRLDRTQAATADTRSTTDLVIAL